MLTYGGIALAQPLPETLQWVEDNISTNDIFDLERLYEFGGNQTFWPAPGFVKERGVRPGTLYWPIGATRFAIGYFFATDLMLAQIRPLVYSGFGISTVSVNNAGTGYTAGDVLTVLGGVATQVAKITVLTVSSGTIATVSVSTIGTYSILPNTPVSVTGGTGTGATFNITGIAQNTGFEPLNLVMTDESGGQITALMSMLPPRPISQAGVNNLYLLTLVDQRYFWWMQAADITVNAGVTTWAQLYSSIGTALGVTITHDTISSSYLTPPVTLEAHYVNLPILLDAVAYSVGQRVVCNLNGTVTTQNAGTAFTSQETLLDAIPNGQKAGGVFALDATVINDLNALVPQSLTVCFPDQADTALHPVQVTLQSLGLAGYASVTGYTGSKVLQQGAVYTGSNGAALTTLADQFATDWYNWQLSVPDIVFAGIAPWVPGGMENVEWVYFDSKNAQGIMVGESGPMLVSRCATRVQRPEWNDLWGGVFGQLASGGITGTGTINYLARWLSSTSLGIGTATDDNTTFTPTKVMAWPKQTITLKSGAITNAVSSGGLIKITSAGHGLTTGECVYIEGVVGTTEANSAWVITLVDSSNFTLNGSTFTNAYVSGGNFYEATINLPDASATTVVFLANAYQIYEIKPADIPGQVLLLWLSSIPGTTQEINQEYTYANIGPLPNVVPMNTVGNISNGSPGAGVVAQGFLTLSSPALAYWDSGNSLWRIVAPWATNLPLETYQSFSGTTSSGMVTVFDAWAWPQNAVNISGGPISGTPVFTGILVLKNTGLSNSLKFEVTTTDMFGSLTNSAVTTLTSGSKAFFPLMATGGTVSAGTPPFQEVKLQVQDAVGGSHTTYQAYFVFAV